MRSAVVLGGVLAAGGTLAAGAARAQDLPESLFARQDTLRLPGNVDPLVPELHPELEPVGSRLGNYMLHASAEVAPMFNSNIRVRPDGDGGAGGYLASRVSLESVGGNDPTSAYVAGSLFAYPSEKTETVGTLAAGLSATRDLTSTFQVRGQIEGGRYFEDRAISFQPNQSYRPVKYERITGISGATANFGRWIVSPEIRFDRLAYHDGRVFADPSRLLEQRTRSLLRYEPGLVVGYAISPLTALYGGGFYDKRAYDRNPAFNSEGYAFYGGIRFRPTTLTRLDVAAGYQRQNYRNNFSDPAGLYLRVEGLYSPDRLTQIRVNYRRDISETGAVEVGGLTRDRIGASIARDVLRNFRLTAGGELRRYDFASINRHDERWLLRAEARFVASRRIDLFARAEQVISTSRGAELTTYDYNRTIVMGGVNLKL